MTDANKYVWLYYVAYNSYYIGANVCWSRSLRFPSLSFLPTWIRSGTVHLSSRTADTVDVGRSKPISIGKLWWVRSVVRRGGDMFDVRIGTGPLEYVLDAIAQIALFRGDLLETGV